MNTTKRRELAETYRIAAARIEAGLDYFSCVAIDLAQNTNSQHDTPAHGLYKKWFKPEGAGVFWPAIGGREHRIFCLLLMSEIILTEDI